MAKMMKPKGKMVKGCDYVEDDEVYDKKMRKKTAKQMKTPGIAMNLRRAEDEEGYSKMPRVKLQKKNMKPVRGQKKVY